MPRFVVLGMTPRHPVWWHHEGKMIMGTGIKWALFVCAVVLSFVAVANTAVVWHGALFVALVLPWAWAVSVAFDRVR